MSRDETIKEIMYVGKVLNNPENHTYSVYSECWLIKHHNEVKWEEHFSSTQIAALLQGDIDYVRNSEPGV